MGHAVQIPHHDAAVATLDHRRQRLGLLNGRGRNVVLFKEARQFSIWIENITILIGAVKAAAPERIQQFDGFPRRVRARTQNGDLAFEHLIESANYDPTAVDAHQVVGMIQAVLSPVGANRVVDIFERQVAKSRQFRALKRSLAT